MSKKRGSYKRPPLKQAPTPEIPVTVVRMPPQVFGDGIGSLAITNQLTRMLAGQLFREAPRQADFLKAAVDLALEGNEATQAEMAFRIFGLNATASDQISVRVHAAKTRKTLAKYYASEGCDDKLVIALPNPKVTSIFDGKIRLAKRLRGTAYQASFFWNPKAMPKELAIANTLIGHGSLEELVKAMGYVDQIPEDSTWYAEALSLTANIMLQTINLLPDTALKELGTKEELLLSTFDVAQEGLKHNPHSADCYMIMGLIKALIAEPTVDAPMRALEVAFNTPASVGEDTSAAQAGLDAAWVEVKRVSKDMTAAMRYFTRARDLGIDLPSHPYFWKYLSIHRYWLYLKVAERMAADAPGDAGAQTLLGLAYSLAERWQDAVTALEAALSLDKMYRPANMLLFKMYHYAGRPEAARSLYESRFSTMFDADTLMYLLRLFPLEV